MYHKWTTRPLWYMMQNHYIKHAQRKFERMFVNIRVCINIRIYPMENVTVFSYFNFENIKTSNHSSTKICYYRKDKHKQNIQKVKKESKQHRNSLTYNISSSIICNKIGIVAECPLFEWWWLRYCFGKASWSCHQV